jgi:hypothetical protein
MKEMSAHRTSPVPLSGVSPWKQDFSRVLQNTV